MVGTILFKSLTNGDTKLRIERCSCSFKVNIEQMFDRLISFVSYVQTPLQWKKTVLQVIGAAVSTSCRTDWDMTKTWLCACGCGFSTATPFCWYIPKPSIHPLSEPPILPIENSKSFIKRVCAHEYKFVNMCFFDWLVTSQRCTPYLAPSHPR